jgi:hypothetical protein
VSRACIAHLDIGIVNSATKGNSTATGVNLTVPHTLQTSLAANAYRLVVVGVTGFGLSAASLPLSVRYDNVDMTLAKALSTPSNVGAAIYYIQGANLPATTGTYNVLLTSSGTSSFLLTANVVELINVEQSTSALDAVGGQASASTCTAHPPSDTVNVSVSGDYIYSALGVIGQTNDAAPNQSNQTVTAQSGVSSLGTIEGYLKSTVTGSRTLAWSIASCTASAHALLSIKPAVTP